MKARMYSAWYTPILLLVGLLAGACSQSQQTVVPTLQNQETTISTPTAATRPVNATIELLPSATLPPGVIVIAGENVAQTATAVARRGALVMTPACPEAPATRMIVNERGRVALDGGEVNDSLNLRNGPDISYRVLRKLNRGDIFFVVGGPECAGEFIWYRVVAAGVTGWIAEGDEDEYYVEPYLPG